MTNDVKLGDAVIYVAADGTHPLFNALVLRVSPDESIDLVIVEAAPLMDDTIMIHTIADVPAKVAKARGDFWVRQDEVVW